MNHKAGPIANSSCGGIQIKVKRKNSILKEEYEKNFVDVRDYNPHLVFLLRGLAAAIQDVSTNWRPNVSELINILKSCDGKYRNRLLNAGASYGAAKQIGETYPGPSILLLGAALESIGEGSYPNKKIKDSINKVKSKLITLEIEDDKDFKDVLDFANQIASHDKGSELVRNEFRKGLKSEGYPPERIDDIVKELVFITNDVRHRAVIDKMHLNIVEPDKLHMVKMPSGESVGLLIGDKEISKYEGETYLDQYGAKIPTIVRDFSETISDPFAEYDIPEGGNIMMTSSFHSLLPYALKGCANRILSCISKIRPTSK